MELSNTFLSTARIYFHRYDILIIDPEVKVGRYFINWAITYTTFSVFSTFSFSDVYSLKTAMVKTKGVPTTKFY